MSKNNKIPSPIPGLADDFNAYADGGMADAPPPGFNELASDVPSNTQTDQLGANSKLSPNTQGSVPIGPDSPPPGFDDLAQQADLEDYSTPEQQGKAFLEGAGQGIAGPLAPLAEKGAGIDSEDILKRKEANPFTSAAGEVAGLAGSMLVGTGEGAIAAKLGTKAAEFLNLGGEGASLASKIGAEAADSAIQGALVSGSDAVSKMILNDPNTSAHTAIVDTGLGALLGAGTGAALGSVSPLFKMVSGAKLSQVIEDMKGRFNFHAANPDPIQGVHDELKTYYNNMKDASSNVFGPSGVKADAIKKLVPPMNQDIANESANNLEMLQKASDKLANDPLAGKLNDAISSYQKTVSPQTDYITGKPINPASSEDVFNATQNLKQQLQEWGKYNKNIVPLAEHDFRNTAQDLAYNLRTSLENPDIWGNAADLQQQVNSSFSKYLPALKDFESKFTTKVSGEPEIDPTKIQTYMNQLGKPNAEIKQTMLRNYLDASEKYATGINQAHVALGIDPPNMASPLTISKTTLGSLPTGAKLADIIVNKGLGDVAASGLGAATGAAIGHTLGAGEMGALIGEHALKPFFKSILPAIAKPVFKLANSFPSFRAVTDYAGNVVSGASILDKGAKSLFKAGSSVVSENSIPTVKQRLDLDDKLEEFQKLPEKMADLTGSIGEYLPDHAVALGGIAASAVQYLNSIRPGANQNAPLDKKQVPNSVDTSKYNNALNIAENPMIVMDKIKSGRLTMNDVEAMSSMFPQLYQTMRDKITEQMMTHIAKNNDIPYSMRMSLSTFLGQPLDSTMQPQNIIAAQAQNLPAPPAPGPQKAPNGGKQPGSTKSLTNLPKQSMTQQQAAEADQAKR